jgi:hypothetical protein
VEYFDLKPVPEAAAGPSPAAQAPPRSIKDFIMMSLPSFKPSEPKEAPQEAPKMQRDMLQEKMLDRTPTLVDKSAPLERASNMKLDARLDRPTTKADLSEIARKTDDRAIPQLNALDAPKTISLAAVGRRAVAPSAPGIRLDSGTGPTRSTMRDMPVAAAHGTASGPVMAAPAGISLKEDQPVRRGYGALPTTPSIGYGRGGGISLSEKPAGRPAASVLPAPAAAKTEKAAADIEQAKPSHKGVEIAGPLAGRKIVSMVLPTYPEWARSKGIEAEVMIRFFVSADGHVIERMLIERTSGYKELAAVCAASLKMGSALSCEGG